MQELIERDLATEHKFGGSWTMLKLDVLAAYLSFYTTALKNKGFRLIYADAFAGSGECTVKVDNDQASVDGSVSLALRTNPPFDEFLFIEEDAKRYAALQAIKEANKHRAISVCNGDANSVLPEWLSGRSWKRTRGVLFLDPYGMSPEWPLLQEIARTEALDLWYLFPLSAFFRQAANDFAQIDDGKAEALTRLVGTADWHSALYSTVPQIDLFDPEPRQKRHASVTAIVSFVTQRLETEFQYVERPLILRNPKNRAPLFALYFAVSNPEPKAVGLARRAAKHILDKARVLT